MSSCGTLLSTLLLPDSKIPTGGVKKPQKWQPAPQTWCPEAPWPARRADDGLNASCPSGLSTHCDDGQGPRIGAQLQG